MNSKKRILIVNCQSMYVENNTGITLRSIFGDISNYEIMELYQADYPKIVDEHVINSYQLPCELMPINYHVRKLLGKSGGYFSEVTSTNNNNFSVKKRTEKKVRERSLLEKLFIFLLEKSYIKKQSKFYVPIDEFKPEIIYTMGTNSYVHKWTLFFSKRYNAPIVMHYMDNWRETQFLFNGKKTILQFLLEKQVEKLEKRMEIGMTISDYMCDVYEEKYNNKYESLMHVVKDENLNYYDRKEITILYAGGLHLGRDKSLHEVYKCIENLKNINLKVYTSRENRELYEAKYYNDCVIFNDPVAHDKIFEIYKDADILLHMESFEPEIIEFTKYSLSTKIPEYMISKRPILCFAPSEIASYKHIDKYKAGVCCKDKSEIKEAIYYLLDYDNRMTLGKNGYACAAEKHSKKALDQTLEIVFGHI